MSTSQELRVSPRSRSEQSEDSRVRSRGEQTSRARILVIDDEPLLGRTLSFMLEEHHDVVVLPGGGEALERLEQDPDFDLVLCDLDMPYVNGKSVYEGLVREHPALVARFVLMTGGACSRWAEEFLSRYRGAQLEKPFSSEEVEKLLDLILDSRA